MRLKRYISCAIIGSVAIPVAAAPVIRSTDVLNAPGSDGASPSSSSITLGSAGTSPASTSIPAGPTGRSDRPEWTWTSDHGHVSVHKVFVIDWGDFARKQVTVAVAGFQDHPEYLLRSIHRLTDFKLDASDDAFGIAYACMMVSDSFGMWTQTSRVLREYRNKHPAEQAAAKLAIRSQVLGNKNMFKHSLKHIEELRRDFGLTTGQDDPGYQKDVSSAARRQLMYHHSLPHIEELCRDFGLKVNDGDPTFRESVASAGGLRNQYHGSLPHIEELRRDFGLKVNKGDPG